MRSNSTFRRFVLAGALVTGGGACTSGPAPAGSDSIAADAANDRGQVGRSPDGTASLEGTLSLRSQRAARRRGATKTVYLLRETRPLHTSIANICARYGARLLQLEGELLSAPPDTATPASPPSREEEARLAAQRLAALNAAKLSLAAEIDEALKSLLSRHEVARSTVSSDGRYRFSPVVPGSYRLYATTRVGESPYTWWSPVEVARGERVRKDLNNAVETLAGGPASGLCGPIPRARSN